MLDVALGLLLAPACVACHVPLARPTGGPVCDGCWAAVPWYLGRLCERCGQPLPDGATCLCEDLPTHLSAIACAARYEGAMRPIVQAFKYGGHQTLGPRLARHLAAHPHLHLDAVDLVVPVPLHPWRRLRRGFNQAERLARALDGRVAQPLARLRWRHTQAGLPGEARRRNVRGAIGVRPCLTAGGAARVRAMVEDARILLVDDVVTTGGTLSACAQVLREAGARDVRAAVVARAER